MLNKSRRSEISRALRRTTISSREAPASAAWSLKAALWIRTWRSISGTTKMLSSLPIVSRRARLSFFGTCRPSTSALPTSSGSRVRFRLLPFCCSSWSVLLEVDFVESRLKGAGGLASTSGSTTTSRTEKLTKACRESSLPFWLPAVAIALVSLRKSGRSSSLLRLTSFVTPIEGS